MSTTKVGKISVQTALLYDDELMREILGFRADLNQLFTTLDGEELLDAVINSTQRYAVELCDETIDRDFYDIECETLEIIREIIRDELSEAIAGFISDEHREAIVRYHARGFSTTEAVATLILEDSTMKRLAQRDAIGKKKLKELLIPRLAYLKPGSTRWPEKKYGAVWQEAREQYIQEINNTPFSTPAERIALLANHAERVNHTLKSKQHSVNDLQVLTESLTKTLESLEKLAPADQQAFANVLPASQLPSVLERFTVALEAFQQIASGGDANAIVQVMEKFTLAMQPPPQQNAITAEIQENADENRA